MFFGFVSSIGWTVLIEHPATLIKNQTEFSVLCIQVTQIPLLKLMLKSYDCRRFGWMLEPFCSLETIRPVDIYFCIISKICESIGGLGSSCCCCCATKYHHIDIDIDYLDKATPLTFMSLHVSCFAFCSLFV